MGEVWKAHDANLDRVVAIKMLLRGALDDATTRERFRREARALSRLSHPGVATVFDFDAQDGDDFLVMEYVPGGTLESRLAAGPLPLDAVLQLGAAIADALENAHRHGVLHRDLKPGNVMLTADGQPKILDFGLAVLLSGGKATGRMTESGTVVGSLPYMAPEQLFGEADDIRTDVYALGVMLFEMATGQRPFVKAAPRGADVRDHQQRRAGRALDQAGRPRRARPAAGRLPATRTRRTAPPRRRPVGDALRRIRDGRSGPTPAPPGERRDSGDRGAPVSQRLAGPGAGVLRRRHDRGDHLRPGAHPGAPGDLAHLGDEVQGHRRSRFPRSPAS